MKTFYFLVIAGLSLSCQSKKKPIVDNTPQFREFQKTYLDTERNRDIPVNYYVPYHYQNEKLPVIIFSHGYGKNQPNSYKEYSALLSQLAANGYFVASIQHELPKDSLLPTEGKPLVVRKSNWERGAQNIMYTYNRMKKDYPYLNFKEIIIAGHSNGGDMSVLFTEHHPDLVWKLITLDQKRYPFPLYTNMKIYSLRSSDQVPDDGVLPSPENQKKLGYEIVKLKKTIHDDMDNSGNPKQIKEIKNYFMKFLKE